MGDLLGEPSRHVPDEALEIGAVHRGVDEAVSGPVPVRVLAAAADVQDGAGPAGGGQRVRSRLPGRHRGVAQHLVEGVAEDVEAGLGRAVVGRLQGVHLLDRPVGLHDHRFERRESQVLGRSRPAEQEGDARLEQADPCLASSGPPPAVEHRAEPVAVALPVVVRRRGRPVAVRQEQVEGRRAQGEERVVRLHRVQGRVDDREDAGVGGREAVGEQPDAPGGGGPGRPSGVVDAPCVVAEQAAVEADADADAGGGHGVEAGRGEQRGVRLDRRVHRRAVGDAGPDQGGEAGERVRPGQQGFAAVQDQGEVGGAVGARVLGDPGRGALQYGRGRRRGTVAPGVVGARVEVAVAAREVAAAVHFHDELAERDGHGGGRGTDGYGDTVRHSVTPHGSVVPGPVPDRGTGKRRVGPGSPTDLNCCCRRGT